MEQTDFVLCKVAHGELKLPCNQPAMDTLTVSIQTGPVPEGLPPLYVQVRLPVCIEHLETLDQGNLEDLYINLSETRYQLTKDRLA